MLFGCSLSKKVELSELANKAIEWDLINGDSITKQRISQQIDERGFEYFKKLFEHLLEVFLNLNRDMRKKITSEFKHIYAVDSTTIELAHKMISQFEGTKKQAAIKVHTKFDLASRIPVQFKMTDAKRHDSMESFQETDVENILWLRDLGYYYFDLFLEIENSNSYYVSRVKDNIIFEIMDSNLNNQKLSATTLDSLTKDFKPRYDLIIRLSNTSLVRLVGYFDKIEQEYRFYITNLMDHFQWTTTEIIQLYKKRWLIEIFFRYFKRVLGCFKISFESERRIQSQIWICFTYFVLIMLFMVMMSIKCKIDFSSLSFKECSKYFVSKLVVRNMLEIYKIPNFIESILFFPQNHISRFINYNSRSKSMF